MLPRRVTDLPATKNRGVEAAIGLRVNESRRLDLNQRPPAPKQAPEQVQVSNLRRRERRPSVSLRPRRYAATNVSVKVEPTPRVLSAVIAALVSRSDARHTITLWHLMERLPPADRGPVVDALLRLAPPAANVATSHIVAGKADALRRWRSSVERTWSKEDVPAWKRLWRGVWRPFMRSPAST